jgi:hypothetical protein
LQNSELIVLIYRRNPTLKIEIGPGWKLLPSFFVVNILNHRLISSTATKELIYCFQMSFELQKFILTWLKFWKFEELLDMKCQIFIEVHLGSKSLFLCEIHITSMWNLKFGLKYLKGNSPSKHRPQFTHY